MFHGWKSFNLIQTGYRTFYLVAVNTILKVLKYWNIYKTPLLLHKRMLLLDYCSNRALTSCYILAVIGTRKDPSSWVWWESKMKKR